MTRPMDNLVVEIAPGADLTADPTTWPWVDITQWVHSPVTITHGYRDESNTSGPEEISLTVQNDDGRFSPDNPMGPWFGTLHEGTPLRAYWDTPDNERGLGYITQLPIQWRVPATTAISQIVASGIFRQRLERGEVLQSALKRSIVSNPNVIAYWPMEDGSDATEFASPVDGVSPMTFTGDVDPGSVDGPGGSMPLPSFRPGSAWSAAVPDAAAASWHAYCLFRLTEPVAAFSVAIGIQTKSPVATRWSVRFSDSHLKVEIRDEEGVVVEDSDTSIDASAFDDWISIHLGIRNAGSGSAGVYVLQAWSPGRYNEPFVQRFRSTSALGSGVGDLSVARIAVGPMAPTPEERHVAHLALFGTPFFSTAAPIPTDVDTGHLGEEAAVRFARLSNEEGIRWQMPAAELALKFPGLTGDHASTPDHVSLDITGDLDVRCEMTPETLNPFRLQALVAKTDSGTANEQSYLLYLNSETVHFLWSPNGSVVHGVDATESLPNIPRQAVRVTIDVDNGAGGHTVRFYTASSISGPWEQLGEPVSAPGENETSIFASTAPVTIGAAGVDGQFDSYRGLIHAVEIRDGIDGTTVADPDFSESSPGDTSLIDSTGKVWSLHGGTWISPTLDGQTPAMGPQLIAPLTVNLQDCADVDVSMYFESHGGVAFRSRRSLYGQEDALSLTPQPHMPIPPEPTRDDRRILNDITAQRPNGSSARVLDQADIDKRGPLRDAVTVNVERDDQLEQQAAWRVALGTVPGMRWPSLPLRLSPHNPDLIAAWLATRIGDRADVDHDFLQIPGVDVDLLIEGWTESWDAIQWDAQLNCVPASPYAVWELEPDPGSPAEGQRLATAGATLDAAITDSATSFDVSSAGQPWVNSTDHAAQFPFSIEIGGERMSVGAISGATSPQTFSSVTRSANGVVKPHDAGAAVQVADPYRSAL
jgi:hypothetical protein